MCRKEIQELISQVQELTNKLSDEQSKNDDVRHRLAVSEAKLDIMSKDYEALKTEHEKYRKQTGVLLGFIQQTHRLTPKTVSK